MALVLKFIRLNSNQSPTSIQLLIRIIIFLYLKNKLASPNSQYLTEALTYGNNFLSHDIKNELNFTSFKSKLRIKLMNEKNEIRFF